VIPRRRRHPKESNAGRPAGSSEGASPWSRWNRTCVQQAGGLRRMGQPHRTGDTAAYLVKTVDGHAGTERVLVSRRQTAYRGEEGARSASAQPSARRVAGGRNPPPHREINGSSDGHRHPHGPTGARRRTDTTGHERCTRSRRKQGHIDRLTPGGALPGINRPHDLDRDNVSCWPRAAWHEVLYQGTDAEKCTANARHQQGARRPGRPDIVTEPAAIQVITPSNTPPE